jgi:predicted nucleotidyltransferase
MDKLAIQTQIGKSVHNADPEAEVILFGSHARGNTHKESDWDILILVNSSIVTNEIEDNFRRDLYEIELESGQMISTLIYPKEYWVNKLKFSPLFKSVMQEGIRL